MVQVVLSLERASDERLRQLAHELYGGRKGALSKVVEDALSLLESERKQKAGFGKLLFLADRARSVGVGKVKRAGLYD